MKHSADFDILIKGALDAATQVFHNLPTVTKEKLELHQQAMRVMDDFRNRAQHHRTAQSAEDIKRLAMLSSDNVTWLLEATKQAWDEGIDTNSNFKEKASAISASLPKSAAARTKDVSLRLQMFELAEQMAWSTRIPSFYCALLGLFVADGLGGEADAYRSFLDVPPKISFEDASKRIGKALAADAIGILVPPAGTIVELIRIAKEAKAPKIIIQPSTSSDNDRMNAFNDNLRAVNESASKGLLLVKEAKTEFEHAKEEFEKATSQLLAILS